MASIEDRSFDPDHEPRKEGSMKMKNSPSVAEIGLLPNIDGLSDGASIGGAGDKTQRKGSISRSPARVGAHITDNEDDPSEYRSLNRDNKHQRSNRKIKPMYLNN